MVQITYDNDTYNSNKNLLILWYWFWDSHLKTAFKLDFIVHSMYVKLLL